MVDQTSEEPGRRPAANRAADTIRITRAVVGALIVLVALSGALDGRAQEYGDRVFKQSLATFAVARALDAAISMAQGTEIAVSPAGMGVTLSAGELLDPVNDLVEQFSWVMLVSTTSLGIQNLLLRVSGWWVLSGVLLLAMIARVVVDWVPAQLDPRWARLLQRILVVAFVVRFTMPLMALGSAVFFAVFLEPARAASVQVLEETSGDLRELGQLAEPSAEPQRQGWRDRLSAWFSETLGNLDVEARIQAFRERMGEVAEHVINLIVVFVLQTILLPLGFLWLLPRVLGWSIGRLDG